MENFNLPQPDWKSIKIIDNQFYLDGKPLTKKFLQVLKFHAPGLAPVCDETGWYHIKANGEELYTSRYEHTFGFYCNRAAVTGKDGCFHIDTDGNQIYAKRYSWCGNFQEDKCTVRDGGHYFHIDLCGNPIYNEKYLYAGDFRDGIACVKCGDQLWRHIKSDGTMLNGKGFRDLGVFHKNIATARDDKGWFHIDADGNELYSQHYAMVEPFYNGFALVEKQCGNFKVIIDETGRQVHCLNPYSLYDEANRTNLSIGER